jgi:hypothetical protein
MPCIVLATTDIYIYIGNVWYRNWLRHALQAGKSGVRFPMRPSRFLIDLIPPVALSLYKRNEYQGFVLRDKDGRWLGLTTLPPSRADF